MSDAKQRQRAKTAKAVRTAKEKRQAAKARANVIRDFSLDFVTINVSPIHDQLVKDVSERVFVTEERVRAYIADPKDQNQRIFKGFAYFGVYPQGKSVQITER